MEESNTWEAWNGGYVGICEEAIKNEEVFKNFKRDRRYTNIVEHATYETAKVYYDTLVRENSPLLGHLKEFSENDTIGNSAIINDFNGIKLSNTTMGYVWYLHELLKSHDLNGMNILEIGGGYGGLCKTISSYCNFKSYTIADLYWPSRLADKYLDSLGVQNVETGTFDELEEKKYDLVISVYAFSELLDETQKAYKKKFLNNCEHGYILSNHLDIKVSNVTDSDYKITKPIEEIPNLPGEHNIVLKIKW